MNFRLFEPISQEISRLTTAYVTDVVSQVAGVFAPFLGVVLTITFIVYAWFIMRGVLGISVVEFISRCIRIVIITSIALAGGLYQQEIVEMIVEIPDNLVSEVSTLVKGTLDRSSAARLLDDVANRGFDCAGLAFEEAGFLGSDGNVYGLFGVLILLATSFLVAISSAFIFFAKIALILLTALGPLCIIALLWQSTYRFFEQWVSQILNYVILIVLFTSVFSVVMNIFGNYVTDLRFDGSQNVSYAIGGLFILSIISVVFFLKLSNIASNLANGVTLGFLWAVHSSYKVVKG